MDKKFIAPIKNACAAFDGYTALLNRSIDGLYEALSVVYGELYLPALEDKEGFIEAAKECREKVTGKTDNPIALLAIKVASHNSDPKHDMRRCYGEWATVLAEMQFKGITADNAYHYLKIKGTKKSTKAARNRKNPVSKQEREEARQQQLSGFIKTQPQIGSVSKHQDGEEVTVLNTAKDQQTLQALAQQPGKVLLLGEIDDEFNLRVICIVERDNKKTEEFLIHKSKATSQLQASNDNSIQEAA